MRRVVLIGIFFTGCLLDTGGRGSGTDDGTTDATTTSTSTTTSTTTDVSTTGTTTTTDATGTTAASTGATGEAGSSSGGEIELGPFMDAVPVSEVNTEEDEDDPCLSADGLELYFDSTRGGSNDIFLATRRAVDEPWSMPSVVAELSTAGVDATPRLSEDGRTIYIARSPLGNNPDILVSQREGPGKTWSAPMGLGDLSSPSDDNAATPSSILSSIVLCSDRGGDYDIYMASADFADLTFGTPAVVEEVSGASYDCGPSLSVDGLALYLYSDRPGGVSDSYDIFVAERSSTDDPFGAPTLLEGVNTTDAEVDPWISSDGRELYFARVIDGNADLYVSVREPLR